MYLKSQGGNPTKYNCNRFNLDKTNSITLNPSESLMEHESKESVACQTAADQPAGHYDLYAKTTYGDPYQLYNTLQLSADGVNEYGFAVIP